MDAKFLYPLLMVIAAIPALAEPLTPETLKLERYQSKQHAISGLAAGQKGTFLFDTGEGITMISPRLAERIGCTPWGLEVGFRMLGERFEAPRCDNMPFQFGEQSFQTSTTFVYDLSKLTGPDAPALDGALGLDAFAGRTVTLNFPANEIIVETPSSAKKRTQQFHEVPMRISTGTTGNAVDVFLGVKTDKGLAWMTLDSANAGPTVLISQTMAPLFNLRADTREVQPVTLDFGGFKLQTKARVFENMIMDGNVGMQLLLVRQVTLDLANKRAWVSNPASP